MNYIDAHVHVWTSDTAHYPLAAGFTKADMKPASFTAEDLFAHTRPAGVSRVNLIQMSYYGYDNSYMLDVIAGHKGTFCGTAVIDPEAAGADRLMGDLAKKGVRAFRIYPKLTKAPVARWLQPDGYSKMFAAGAKNNQALSCLIDPDALPEIDRMCKKHPGTPVIIDHMARIGVTGAVAEKEVEALCDLAKHKRVMVKVGAFYALGRKTPPYADLAPLIKRLVEAYTPERCMWESDCPFQVEPGHGYAASLRLIGKLEFLKPADRDWLLRRTAEKFFFPAG